jgi:hypothetical protein
VGAGSLSEGVASPVTDAAPLVAALSALAKDRGDNETNAAAPSAMAETRRAPFVMANSLYISGATAPRETPRPLLNFENARAKRTFLGIRL